MNPTNSLKELKKSQPNLWDYNATKADSLINLKPPLFLKL
jgi:hypothetical protein